MELEYTWILRQRKNCRQFILLIGYFVHPLAGVGMGERGWIVILDSYKFHFLREHDNMLKYPSNNISMLETQFLLSCVAICK